MPGWQIPSAWLANTKCRVGASPMLGWQIPKLADKRRPPDHLSCEIFESRIMNHIKDLSPKRAKTVRREKQNETFDLKLDHYFERFDLRARFSAEVSKSKSAGTDYAPRTSGGAMNSLSTLRKREDEPELSQKFRRLTETLCLLFLQDGYKVLPYTAPHVPHFEALPMDMKIAVLGQLENYKHVCMNTLSSGSRLNDHPSFVWQAMKIFHLIPPKDFLAHLRPGHVVEIHTEDGIQIFRNLEYFNYCSYSLEELYCLPWFALFAHQGGNQAEMIEASRKIFSGEIKSTFRFNLPPHLGEEIMSSCRFRCELNLLYGAPLFYKGNVPMASIIIEDIRLLNPEAKLAFEQKHGETFRQPLFDLGDKNLE